MDTYEFVSRNEYGPVREEIESIIKNVQAILKKNDKDMTFQFLLIGSGRRHLITRVKGGNGGYDFDYNLILNDKFTWKPSIRKSFFRAFEEAIKGTRFNKIENSTSVITIKQVSNQESKTIVGCDFSVIYYPGDDDTGYYKYARFNKDNQKYTWEIRNISRFSNERLNWLFDHCPQAWSEIKEEYRNLKQRDKQKKHSFNQYNQP